MKEARAFDLYEFLNASITEEIVEALPSRSSKPKDVVCTPEKKGRANYSRVVSPRSRKL